MQRRFLTSMSRPALRPSSSQCVNEGSGFVAGFIWQAQRVMLLGEQKPLVDRKWGSGHGGGGDSVICSGAWAVKGYVCQLMVFFRFLCRTGDECSDFSQVSKNKDFNLIPTPYGGHQTMADLRLSHHGLRKGSFVSSPFIFVRLQIPHCSSLKRPSS